jgi:hypothetical protein
MESAGEESTDLEDIGTSNVHGCLSVHAEIDVLEPIFACGNTE